MDGAGLAGNWCATDPRRVHRPWERSGWQLAWPPRWIDLRHLPALGPLTCASAVASLRLDPPGTGCRRLDGADAGSLQREGSSEPNGVLTSRTTRRADPPGQFVERDRQMARHAEGRTRRTWCHGTTLARRRRSAVDHGGATVWSDPAVHADRGSPVPPTPVVACRLPPATVSALRRSEARLRPPLGSRGTRCPRS